MRLWRRGCWGGPAAVAGRPAEDVDLDGEALRVAGQLEEERLVAEEAWFDARLAVGEDADLVCPPSGADRRAAVPRAAVRAG